MKPVFRHILVLLSGSATNYPEQSAADTVRQSCRPTGI